MDLDLPNLEMREPDELDPDTTIEEIEEEISIQEEYDDPFIKQPTKELLMKNAKEQVPLPIAKKKRELSQKQLDHLENCRILAKEKREAKKKAKDEALGKINEEHKAKSYKPEKHKAKVDKEYKARTVKIVDKVVLKEETDSPTPDDFIPSVKEKAHKKLVAETEKEQNAFVGFMMNMERYKTLKEGYKEAKEKKKVTQSASPTVRATAQHSTEGVPSVLEVKKELPINPFSGFFG